MSPKQHWLTENRYRPIMTIVDEHPENAFLKGGLFRKSGVELPRPVAEIFRQRAGDWEVPLEGVALLDLD